MSDVKPQSSGTPEFEDTDMPCKLCKATKGNQRFKAREKMLGIGDEFSFLECGSCKVIQLLSPPSEMSTYYPAEYYSFGESSDLDNGSLMRRLQNFAMRAIIAYRTGQRAFPGAMLIPFMDKFKWVRRGMFYCNTAILDVGCGSGTTLQLLHRCGFTDLTGVDPFISHDIDHGTGFRIWKKELAELERKYGFILLSHSFEHLPDPEIIMNQLKERTLPGGRILIRIPVADCYSWKHYGVNWVQLDAPRHFYLHTVKSIQALADKVGLELEHVEFDSTEFQFVGSEKYQRGLTLDAYSNFIDKPTKEAFRQKAKDLNEIGQGDTASFYLLNDGA